MTTPEQPDRRVDYEARERLEVIHHGYQTFATRVLGALLILFVALVAGAGLNAYLLARNGDRTDEVHALIEQVQQQRRDAVQAICKRTNTRYEALVSFISTASPDQADAAARAFSQIDCDQLAREAVPAG